VRSCQTFTADSGGPKAPEGERPRRAGLSDGQLLRSRSEHPEIRVDAGRAREMGGYSPARRRQEDRQGCAPGTVGGTCGRVGGDVVKEAGIPVPWPRLCVAMGRPGSPFVMGVFQRRPWPCGAVGMAPGDPTWKVGRVGPANADPASADNIRAHETALPFKSMQTSRFQSSAQFKDDMSQNVADALRT
jgi:hypothetical protein